MLRTNDTKTFYRQFWWREADYSEENVAVILNLIYKTCVKNFLPISDIHLFQNTNNPYADWQKNEFDLIIHWSLKVPAFQMLVKDKCAFSSISHRENKQNNVSHLICRHKAPMKMNAGPHPWRGRPVVVFMVGISCHIKGPKWWKPQEVACSLLLPALYSKALLCTGLHFCFELPTISPNTNKF